MKTPKPSAYQRLKEKHDAIEAEIKVLRARLGTVAEYAQECARIEGVTAAEKRAWKALANLAGRNL